MPIIAKEFYVYVHAQPGGAPFYVGKGTAKRAEDMLHNRSYEHRLMTSKIKYVIVYKYLCDSEQQALDYETELIAHLRSRAAALVNKTSGGQGSSGYRHTQESRCKMSTARKQRVTKPETRVKLSIAQKLRVTPELRAQRAETMRRVNAVLWADPAYRQRRAEASRVQMRRLNKIMQRRADGTFKPLHKETR